MRDTSRTFGIQVGYASYFSRIVGGIGGVACEQDHQNRDQPAEGAARGSGARAAGDRGDAERILSPCGVDDAAAPRATGAGRSLYPGLSRAAGERRRDRRGSPNQSRCTRKGTDRCPSTPQGRSTRFRHPLRPRLGGLISEAPLRSLHSTSCTCYRRPARSCSAVIGAACPLPRVDQRPAGSPATSPPVGARTGNCGRSPVYYLWDPSCRSSTCR